MSSLQKLKAMKILLVDDNRMLCAALADAFKKTGCFLQTVGSAEEGLQVLKTNPFDIIISDFQLPGINGLEFFEQAAEYQPETVRILISGYGDQSAVSRAYEIGVDSFLEKPFSLPALFNVLISQIGKQDTGGNLHANKPHLAAPF